MATETKTRPGKPANGTKPPKTTEKASPPGAPPEQVLSINTLAPKRPYVVVDDVRHDFRLMQDFGEREHQEWERDTEEYDRLWHLEKPTDDEHNARATLLDSLLDRTLTAPAALREQVGDRLTGRMKRDIVLAFTNASSVMQMNEAMAREQAAKEKAEADLAAVISDLRN